MEFKKKIGLGVLSLATVLGSATAMLSSNTSSVSAESVEVVNESKGFKGLYLYDKTNLYGPIQESTCIWNDGENTYYSYWDQQYIFDKDTKSWIEFTWNGDLTSFIGGSAVWKLGDDYYYDTSGNFYVLDKETQTWNSTTINNLPDSFSASFIWNDGEDTYYSSGSKQFKYDKSTNSWLEFTWNGDMTTPNGAYIWSDLDNIYYSVSMGSTYMLDRSTNTWNIKDFVNAPSMNLSIEQKVWNDGKNVYLSDGSKHFLLDKETFTWNSISFDGFTNFKGADVWSDGTNFYVYKTFLLMFDYVNENKYSQSDLDNAITSNDKEVYELGFADGVASLQENEDINKPTIDVEVEEVKESGFVSFMKWINKYIFFGLFGD